MIISLTGERVQRKDTDMQTEAPKSDNYKSKLDAANKDNEKS